MRFRILYCLLPLWLYAGTYLRAQNFEPHIINYTVDHGLSSSETYAIMQDSKGIVWISTDKGICKYDGLRFSRITTSEGLPDNVVFDLVEDSKGRIWGRTYSKGLFYIENGRVVVPVFNAALLNRLHTLIIDNFCVTPDDSIFMETDSLMLITAHVSSKDISTVYERVRTVRFIQNAPFAYGGHMLPDKQRINIISDERQFQCSAPEQLREVIFRGIVLENKDILFNNLDRLYLIRKDSRKIEIIPHFKSRIIAVFQDSEQGIWIGTVNDGVFYYPGNLDHPPRHYFERESVSDFMEDREGNIWITTLKSGIYFIVNKHVLSLGGLNEPFTVVEKVGGQYIACSKNSAIYFLSTDGVQEISNAFNTMVSYKVFYDVFEYDKQTLLFTGVGSFLMKKHDHRKKKSFNLTTFYRGVRQGGDSNFFYAFNYGSVLRFNRYKSTPLDTFFFRNSRINDLVIDEKGGLWIGSVTGVAYCDRASKFFQETGGGLLRKRINGLGICKNKLFLATAGDGVLIYDIVTKSVKQVAQKEGLSSNSCQSLFIDAENIWVATNKGVSIIRTSDNYNNVLTVSKLDKHDGLPGEEINSVFIDERFVWIASNSGITYFDKNIVAENQLIPQVNFEYTRTNKRVYVNAGESHRFSHDENYLEFSFYGISYKSLRKLRYKYRLTGADDTWHFTYQPRITYPSLTAGIYTFEVYAINNDGVSSSTPIVFAFEIKPPFWQTWIFIGCVSMLLSGGIFMLFYYRLRTIKKREQEKSFYDNRMLEYELRALKAQMNPHFIFNAVASIQNFIMSSDPKSANKYLVKFSKLIRGVLDNSHNNLISLSKELETLKLYIEIENLRLANRISFHIVTDHKVEEGRLMIPPLLIQPFVENAIWHGLSPKEGECELSILVHVVNGKLVCSIDDNGIGREQAAFNKAGTGKRNSRGMEMTRNRIVAMEKIYNMSLGIEVIDKKDEQQRPTGTRVIITLPIIT